MRYKKRSQTQVNLKDFTKYNPCWTCKNCNDTCVWIAHGKAINNWIAIPTYIAQNQGFENSYRIMYCPNYKMEV